MTCLIDTSAWIEALRKDGDPSMRQKVGALIAAGQAAFCELVRLELWNGARGDGEKAKLADIEQAVPNLPIDDETWRLAMDLARASRGQGLTIPCTDLVIGACARRHGATLLHRDSHLDQIAALGAEPARSSPPLTN